MVRRRIPDPWPKRGPINAGLGPLRGVADEPVERGAVRALDALLELRVDVEGHLRVGVADLAHDPEDGTITALHTAPRAHR